jgi:glycosyltransferase involved in cell wall biosynthesis
MTKLERLAFLGNSLPRRCGIATFTTDLQQAVAQASPAMTTSIVAMTDHGHTYAYPSEVALQIRDDKPEDYVDAAQFLNVGGYDAVSLQHEFGIFGGDHGAGVLPLLRRLEMPVVTTFHTVLACPSETQRAIMSSIADTSARVIVMAAKGKELLRNVYAIAPEKVDIVPHGIPDFPFVEPAAAKAALGYAGRPVILTFGLLSPNKGIEVMIDAMPEVLRRKPDAIYVVLGATHPNLVRDQGEAYRESLMARVQRLGIEGHVVFLDQFVDKATLLGFIAMCDVYVTPYLNEAQMTSGTLAYSFGLGKAVVSTPYWHARELLASNRGVLVPFSDAGAIGVAVADLLTDDARRLALREVAYAASRSMTWEKTAERYVEILGVAAGCHQPKAATAVARGLNATHAALPALRTNYLQTMCDDTGLFQHAVHSVPDRHHGYCVDDNARALLLSCSLNRIGEKALSEALTSCFAAFVQHAWNPDRKRFRNFMSFDRRWLEETGSEDSHGRTLWALGVAARDDCSPSRNAWAAALFEQALPVVLKFSSPRAWAFALLGLDAYCAVKPDDLDAARTRKALADRVLMLLVQVERTDWIWFEESLGYDNARLPQALLLSGMSTGVRSYVDAGLRSLRWLASRQTSPGGHFRPIGTMNFGTMGDPSHAFDQQPVEAAAMIAACLTATRASTSKTWSIEAKRAFAWFLGKNDLATPLVDVLTGSCRDGLHPDRANENRGGESVVSYLLALADIRQFARTQEKRPAASSYRQWQSKRPLQNVIEQRTP